MPTIDNWRALREALDAGPTEGPWIADDNEGFGAWKIWRHMSPSGSGAVDGALLMSVHGDSAESDATAAYIAEAHPAAIRSLLDERDRLAAEVEALKDAARINLENYEFQRNKADAATATVYQFHYAMKDAGWHPGRTDDNLCDILRAKGQELAGAAAEVEALRADAGRYRWLRDVSVPPHNFYVAVPVEFEGVKYTPAEVDAAIDAAMKGKP